MGQKYRKRTLAKGFALGLAVLTGSVAFMASKASAQSTFGCSDLAGRHSMPSVEGTDGVFFRIDPDLHMFHSISDESIAQLAKLSKTLKETGITLIYTPVPTRALAMPQHLPLLAIEYGYKTDLAATVFDDSIRRMAQAKILTTNVRHALRKSGKDRPPFFATDTRLTPDGAQQMALAIAETIAQSEGADSLPKAQFSTQSGAMQEYQSKMRAILQRHCTLKLATVEAPQFATTKTQATSQDTDTSIFADRSNSPRIALVGTDVTGSPVSNLAGFLSQATGLDVVQYSVPDGGSFAAISSYLTSSAFQEAQPAFLVWTNPIENNLGQYGDQPLRELTAAVSGTCRVAVPFSGGAQSNTIGVDLSRLELRPSNTLYVDTDGAEASEMQLDFSSRNGVVRSKFVARHPGQVKTGRFYVPLSGLWREGAQTVDITLDTSFGPDTLVSMCFE